MTSTHDHPSTGQKVMERQDEQTRLPFRSLRGHDCGPAHVTAFGLENVRIGGDEKKLRNHYGFNPGDLGNASTGLNDVGLATSAPLIRSVESNENLRKRRGEQKQPSHSKSQERLRDAALSDERGLHSKGRDAPKFSFRKVFGLNGTEQSGVDRSRDSVYPHDTEPSVKATVSKSPGSETQRRASKANKRRTSNDDFGHPPMIFPETRHVRDFVSSKEEHLDADLAAEPPTVPTRRRQSTVKRVPSDDKTTRRRSATLAELSQVFTSRPITPALPSPSISHSVKHKIPDRRSSSRHKRASKSRNHFTVDVPLIPILPSDQELKSNSGPGSSNSDEKKTIRPEKRRPLSPSRLEPWIPPPNYVLPSDYASPTSPSTWTAPRQAMEAASFFARIGELENRMASLERSLANFKHKEKEQQHQHGQQGKVLRSMPLGYAPKNSYMANVETADATAISHPYLTPPSSQLSEASVREPAETWLDPSSSTSSFADSLSAASKRPSSKTSLYPSTSGQSQLASISDDTPRPYSRSKQGQAPISTTTPSSNRDLDSEFLSINDSNDTRSYILSKLAAERASRRLAVNAELASLRADLFRLRTDAASSPGPFGKVAPLTSSPRRIVNEPPEEAPHGRDDRDVDEDEEDSDEQSSDNDADDAQIAAQPTYHYAVPGEPYRGIDTRGRTSRATVLRSAAQSRQGYHSPGDVNDERSYDLSRASTRTELSRPETRLKNV